MLQSLCTNAVCLVYLKFGICLQLLHVCLILVFLVLALHMKLEVVSLCKYIGLLSCHSSQYVISAAISLLTVTFLMMIRKAQRTMSFLYSPKFYGMLRWVISQWLQRMDVSKGDSAIGWCDLQHHISNLFDVNAWNRKNQLDVNAWNRKNQLDVNAWNRKNRQFQ